MRLAALLALLSSVVFAQGRIYDRVCEFASRRSSRGSVACKSASRAFALFEFAPPEGTGLSSACACAVVTGAKGEAMTFTRASTGWCTKGNETSGIATGDLVECSSDKPRIMPGGDGSGGLGISVWEARTNSTLRSQQFDNAVWVKGNSGGAAVPTITADQATAPDGTLTADRIQIPATTTAQSSQVSQATSCPAAGQVSSSVYVRGNGTSGTFDFQTTVPCAYNSTTWTRCVRENFATTGQILFGNSSVNTGVADGAQDFFAWGAQCEQGPNLGPYITTISAAATRAAESAVFDSQIGVATAAGSAAVTGNTTSLGGGGLMMFDSLGRMFYDVGAWSIRTFDGTSVIAVASAGGPHRYWSSWTGATRTITNATDALTTAGGFDGTMGAGTTGLRIGGEGTFTGFADSVVKGVCLDSSTTVCR